MSASLAPSLPAWRVVRLLAIGAMVLACSNVQTLLAAAQGPQDHLQQAVALISSGNLEAAEKEAQKALATPSAAAPAYTILGTIRLQQGRLDESSQYLRKAMQLNPNLLGARLTLGQVYALQGKTSPARQTFLEAMKLDPQNPVPRLNLAQFEAANKNFQASFDLVKPITASLRASPDGLVLLLTDYLGLGQKDEARALVPDWLALGEGVPTALVIEFAKPLMDNGLSAEAVRVLENAKGPGPATFEIAFGLGGAYLANGDSKRAAESYEQAASLNARCAACFQKIAALARHQGENEKAMSYLIKAKALEPENPEILFEFGRLCLEGDLIVDAVAALEKAVQLNPNNDRYKYVLASAYVGKVRYKDALAILSDLLKRHPEDPLINYALGSVLYIEGTDLDAAENYLRRSIQLQPDQVGAYYYLGMTVFKKGDQDQAVEIFHKLLDRHPDHVASLEQLGTILVRQRKYEEAQQVLEKVLRLDPNSLTGHYQYGQLLGRLGKTEESAKHIEIAKQLEEVRKKESKMEYRLLNPH
jgi:tetratricopeptide (TPR) repeat protein